MENYTEKELREGRPLISVADAISFSLNRLFEDDEHLLEEDVVKGLTFEELVGALLLAESQAREA